MMRWYLICDSQVSAFLLKLFLGCWSSGVAFLQRHSETTIRAVRPCVEWWGNATETYESSRQKKWNRSIMIKTRCAAHLGDERWAWPTWIFNGWYHILYPPVWLSFVNKWIDIMQTIFFPTFFKSNTRVWMQAVGFCSFYFCLISNNMHLFFSAEHKKGSKQY